MQNKRQFKCYECTHEWELPLDTGASGRKMKCPICRSTNIHRLDIGRPGRSREPSSSGRGQGGPGRGPISDE